MKKSEKVKDNISEEFERKDYFDNKVVIETRTMFQARCKMFQCKMNYSNDPKYKRELWLCDSCQSSIDTQSHVMVCPAYQILREGKDMNNDRDVVRYFVSVMIIREKLNLTK